jgi:uncharacterized membrane protein YgdD (TMEM256/DUF423 family)
MDSADPLDPVDSVNRIFLVAACILGFLGVTAAAFGAHALAQRVTAQRLAAFETGSRIQLFHALALLAATAIRARWPGRAATAACWLFVAGIVLFAGSLYLLVLLDLPALGAITPAGGACLLGGWLALAIAVGRAPR